MRIHLAIAALGGLLTTPTALCAQQSEADWSQTVAKAANHRRYGVRRAIANKLARSGPAAAAAVRRFGEEHGVNEVPGLIIDALQQQLPAEPGDDDSARQAWLAFCAEHASDESFYWRAQCLKVLATKDPESHVDLFRHGLQDPSWLFRKASALGLALAAPAETSWRNVLTGDPDARTGPMLAIDLVEAGRGLDTEGVAEQLVLGMTYADCVFLGDPWGARLAQSCRRTLRSLADQEFPTAREAAAWCTESGIECGVDVDASDRPQSTGPADIGFEIRSCRYGDVFVAWSPSDGTITQAGLAHRPASGAVVAPDLSPSAHEIANGTTRGNVVCDFIRVRIGDGSEVRELKAAPERLPAVIANWLRDVRCEDGDVASHPAARAVPQFVEREDGGTDR